MDEEKIDLALAFVQSQPAAAAAILERQPLQQVADFIASLPHTHGALVLAKMLPQYTARLCRHLQPTVAAGILSAMDISLIATVIRLCHKDLARQLLDLLPDKTRLACRLLLNYPDDAVGAWMNADISTLPGDCSVADALERIREDPQALDSSVSLVINRGRFLQGRVTLAALLRAPGSALVSAVMVKDNRAISARTALKSAIDNPLWEEHDSIPVINRNQQLVGLLRHLDFRHGLQQISLHIAPTPETDQITGFFDIYARSLLLSFMALGDFARGRTRRDR